MNKEELLKIIKEENLPVNLYLEHPFQEYEVVLDNKENKYTVYATNERAGQQGITSFFDNELEALNDTIMKSRILKKRYHNQ
ncbi:Imm59 family immunity protein [Streptococcus equinus]|uniref:Imm59 family immunity protein n=1 Tax=Streptococcus equinus TaxID=1335 RepID=UPI003C6F5C50